MNRKPRKANDELEYELPMGDKQARVTKKSSQSHFYTLYLDEDIREVSYYRDQVEALSEATPDDFVKVIINTNGGQLDAAAILMQGIRDCQGQVICELAGATHSAGSMIALSANQIHVQPAATMMIHQASFGVGGQSNHVYDHVEFNRKYLNKLIQEVYKDFLTPDEIEKVLTGKEYWFDSEEIGVRLERMFAVREKSILAQVEQLEQAAEKLKSEVPVVEKPPTAKKTRKSRKTEL